MGGDGSLDEPILQKTWTYSAQIAYHLWLGQTVNFVKAQTELGEHALAQLIQRHAHHVQWLDSRPSCWGTLDRYPVVYRGHVHGEETIDLSRIHLALCVNEERQVALREACAQIGDVGGCWTTGDVCCCIL